MEGYRKMLNENNDIDLLTRQTRQIIYIIRKA